MNESEGVPGLIRFPMLKALWESMGDNLGVVATNNYGLWKKSLKYANLKDLKSAKGIGSRFLSDIRKHTTTNLDKNETFRQGKNWINSA